MYFTEAYGILKSWLFLKIFNQIGENFAVFYIV